MLCSECGERPATVHLQRIINGEKTEMRLCPVCAAELGSAAFSGGFGGSGDSGEPGESLWGLHSEPKISVHELLAGLLPVPSRVGAHPHGEKVCPGCGLTYREFARTGLLGCEQCYETFAAMLTPVFRRVHGSDRHAGRVPPALRAQQKRRRELRDLRARLEQAVAAEQYEEAARLRDKLRGRLGAPASESPDGGTSMGEETGSEETGTEEPGAREPGAEEPGAREPEE